MEERIVTTGVQAFQYIEIVFYGVIWWMAALSGVARAVFDNEYRNWRHLVSIGVLSGFVGLSIVGVSYQWLGGTGGDEFYFVAISCLAGLMGKEQTLFLSFVFRRVLKHLLGEQLYNELSQRNKDDVK